MAWLQAHTAHWPVVHTPWPLAKYIQKTGTQQEEAYNTLRSHTYVNACALTAQHYTHQHCTVNACALTAQHYTRQHCTVNACAPTAQHYIRASTLQWNTADTKSCPVSGWVSKVWLFKFGATFDALSNCTAWFWCTFIQRNLILMHLHSAQSDFNAPSSSAVWYWCTFIQRSLILMHLHPAQSVLLL
jgi:hypothetical protein